MPLTQTQKEIIAQIDSKLRVHMGQKEELQAYLDIIQEAIDDLLNILKSASKQEITIWSQEYPGFFKLMKFLEHLPLQAGYILDGAKENVTALKP